MDTIENGKAYEQELTRIFDNCNKYFYNGELPDVIITFVPTKNAHGHMTVRPVWVSHDENEDKAKYELNISAYTIDRSPDEITATMLHEQAHLYNIIHNIQDCTNMGRYHNRKFKKTAEDHGLICYEYSNYYGYNNTRLTEAAKVIVHSKIRVKQFELKRVENPRAGKTLIKLVCPNCGNFCYVTKRQLDSNSVLCGSCKLQMTPKKEKSHDE
ncbi:SprT-like domain-containing protein [Porcincola sp. LCP21S3_C12]|uniref:SprT-like domain-containing protein n=1 Tax=Porcincola sp. LCP21S3_C12 TaxID=3438798 RepID=UPI003F95DAC7